MHIYKIINYCICFVFMSSAYSLLYPRFSRYFFRGIDYIFTKRCYSQLHFRVQVNSFSNWCLSPILLVYNDSRYTCYCNSRNYVCKARHGISISVLDLASLTFSISFDTLSHSCGDKPLAAFLSYTLQQGLKFLTLALYFRYVNIFIKCFVIFNI